jgi:hypothetical protein
MLAITSAMAITRAASQTIERTTQNVSSLMIV